MDSIQNRSFNSLVEEFLGVPLPDAWGDQISFAHLPPESQSLALRMLTLMKQAAFPATDFTPLLLRFLSTVAGSSLPSAWGERIPPITMPGRHRKLDAYIAKQPWTESEERPLFLDLGCGFPPVTTRETAASLPDWRIIGIDREFPAYLLYDRDGSYACFDRKGELHYLQTSLNTTERIRNQDPEARRTHFKELFAQMLPQLPASDGKRSTAVEAHGSRLILNHLSDFEAENLTFIEKDFQSIELPPARAVRCMNVLLYTDKPGREKLLSRIGRLLEDEGLLFAGFNHFLGRSARYAVYRKVGTTIAPMEFAFGLDNLRPFGIAPWYTLHDDDPEASLLASLAAQLRSDATFWPGFNTCVDDLLEHLGIGRRGADGFLTFPDQPPSPQELIANMTTLWREIESGNFASMAVDALARAGYHSWINPTGDIAVEPPGDRFPVVTC